MNAKSKVDLFIQLESIPKSIAVSYCRSMRRIDLVEDMISVGRVCLWEYLNRDDFDIDRFGSKSYLRKTISGLIWNMLPYEAFAITRKKMNRRIKSNPGISFESVSFPEDVYAEDITQESTRWEARKLCEIRDNLSRYFSGTQLAVAQCFFDNMGESRIHHKTGLPLQKIRELVRSTKQTVRKLLEDT